MKRGKSFLLKFAVTAVLAAASAAWAQNCPTSPSYAPDFTSNQSCMTLNGNASFPAASAANITSWSGSEGFVTFQATNSFVVGEAVTLSGFTTSTFFNGVTVQVIATSPAGLPPYQSFEVAFSNFTGSGDTESGVATPLSVLQLTPNLQTQAGSAWFNTQQAIANGFSTTFSFALTNTSTYVADGFAFVIQNSSLTALGPTGCGIGFGGAGTGNCNSGAGIQDSIAVEFDTYQNADIGDPNANHVAIQSCGNAANNVQTTSNCNLGGNASLVNPNNNQVITLADGNIHSVTISYTLQPTASETNCFSDSTPQPCLDVILDGIDLFPLGVSVNLSTLLSLNNGAAWVGFTAATGGGDNTQDILSWTFAPQSQSQTGTVTNNGQTTTFPFNGGFTEGSQTTGFDYGAQETDTQLTEQMVVTAIPTPSAACDSLVQASFPGAHCFVYQNGGGQGTDAAVMFEVTCPPNGSCGSPKNPFDAYLTSQFGFLCGAGDNLLALCPSFNPPNNTATSGLPAVGFLKGSGPDPNHPCTPFLNNSPALYQSNQIVSFELGDLSSKPIKGSSGGGTSCWVGTYQTPNEVPTVTITQPVNGGIYPQGLSNASTLANYTCNAANQGANSPTGPYLTVASCTATDTPPGVAVANGTQFDTTTPGLHTFTAEVTDSALNTNFATVTYYVQASAATTVVSSSNPSLYGQPVSFTAAVVSVPAVNPAPTGGVQFVIDSVNYGAPVPLSGGMATLANVTTLPPGLHTVAAVYSGDAYHTSGAAGMLAGGQTVNQPPTITSGNSAAFTLGVMGSFTVTTTGFPSPVSSITELGSLPNGVSFVNNGNGTATLSGVPTQGGSFPITITASNGINPNAVQNFTLTTSGPLLSVSPLSYNFGIENLGLDLDPILITVKNIGTSAAAISGASITDGAGTKPIDFTAVNLCPASLAAGKSCYVGVVFLAGTVGSLSATLNISDNAPGSPQQVTLAATVINPQIKFSPSSLSFGTVKVGNPSVLSVTVSNPGTTPLNIMNVGVKGTNAADFKATNLCPGSLAPGGVCMISVTFTPSATGSRSASLVVTDNTTSGTQAVPLSGKGN